MIRLTVPLVLILLLPSAARADDPYIGLSEWLGFSRNFGSLAPWTTPADDARSRLGSVARNAQQAVMMVGYPGSGHGTAWVLSKSKRLLVTNAHVADIYYEAGNNMQAIPNGTNKRFNVEKVYYHPGVQRYIGDTKVSVRAMNRSDGKVDALSADVAVLQLSAGGDELPAELTVATSDIFSELLAQPVGMLGYPAYDTSTFPDFFDRVEATYHDGVVARYTDFKYSINVPLSRRQYVQYTVSPWPGFSGSPVLLADGRVIAIHNSTWTYKQDTGFVHGNAYGIRIDCLWELLAYHHLNDYLPATVDIRSLDLDRWAKAGPADANFQRALALVDEARDLIGDERNYREGVTRCNEALRLAPNLPDAYGTRCSGYTNYVADYSDKISLADARTMLNYAEQDAKRFAVLNPGNPMATARVAGVLNRQGELLNSREASERARQIADKLLGIASLTAESRAICYDHRAVALAKLGNRDQALADWSEAIRLNPRDPQLFDHRAQEWSEQGRNDLAERDRATARQLREPTAG